MTETSSSSAALVFAPTQLLQPAAPRFGVPCRSALLLTLGGAALILGVIRGHAMADLQHPSAG